MRDLKFYLILFTCLSSGYAFAGDLVNVAIYDAISKNENSYFVQIDPSTKENFQKRKEGRDQCNIAVKDGDLDYPDGTGEATSVARLVCPGHDVMILRLKREGHKFHILGSKTEKLLNK